MATANRSTTLSVEILSTTSSDSSTAFCGRCTFDFKPSFTTVTKPTTYFVPGGGYGRGQTVTSITTASYFIYPDYTITSETQNANTCSRIALTNGLPRPFSYKIVGLHISTSSPTNAVMLSAESAVSDFIGSTCALPPTVAVPPKLSPDLFSPPKTDVLLLVVTSTAPTIVALVALGVLLLWWRRHKVQNNQHGKKSKTRWRRWMSQGTPPFFQKKPELTGQDAKYQIDGTECRYELADQALVEIATAPSDGCPGERRSGMVPTRTELPGEEAAAEKEGDDTNVIKNCQSTIL